MKKAVTSLGLSLDNYSEIVGTICGESNDEFEHNSGNISMKKVEVRWCSKCVHLVMYYCHLNFSTVYFSFYIF